MLTVSPPPAVRPSPARAAWHSAGIDEVLAGLGSSWHGLSEADAAARLAAVGPNRLPPPACVPVLVILRNQLRSVVVGLLIAATVLSLAIGDRLEAAAIATVLVINAALGFITEWRARRAMEALLQLAASHALVKRNGELIAVPSQTLVPGDIVQLDAGNRVPADVRLLQATDLGIDEAPLTGESLPAESRSRHSLGKPAWRIAPTWRTWARPSSAGPRWRSSWLRVPRRSPDASGRSSMQSKTSPLLWSGVSMRWEGGWPG